MLKKYIFYLVSTVIILTNSPEVLAESHFWQIQSIDTMKYSRDLARQKAKDSTFNETIDTQVETIANLGATHVAIATPYDEEFVPFLQKWVDAARRHNLKVWFRGNFSGWEGWFDYPNISAEDHLKSLRHFITNNPGLFEDGDILTPCPECENGGAGDPRVTGDIQGFRNMLFSQREHATFAFHLINKKVNVGYFSMNGDVAKLVMDKKTTELLGGNVVIDHYVKDPETLNRDIYELAKTSGGKIILGEIGVPIPDIHGEMTQKEQNDWLEKTLALLSHNPNIIGLNYWVLEGGSTRIIENNRIKPAAETLSIYFKPQVAYGSVVDELGKPLANVKVEYDGKTAFSDSKGLFKVLIVPSIDEIKFTKPGYFNKVLGLSTALFTNDITLIKTDQNLLFTIRKFFLKLTSLFWNN